MSEKDKDGWSTGHFVNLAKNLPSIEIDCSGWESDIPADQWSHGTFVNLARYVPAVEIDCSDWDRESAVWLELVVSFDAGTRPAAVVKHTHALVSGCRCRAGTGTDLRSGSDARRGRFGGAVAKAAGRGRLGGSACRSR